MDARHGRAVIIDKTRLNGIHDNGKTGVGSHGRADGQIGRSLLFLLGLFLLIAIAGVLGDSRLVAATAREETSSPQGNRGECAKRSATAQQHFIFELFHYASFLRSGYRAGTQHIVGRIELGFISCELRLTN